jgi:hypothetical protein
MCIAQSKVVSWFASELSLDSEFLSRSLVRASYADILLLLNSIEDGYPR